MIKNVKGDLVYFTFESFDKTGIVKHCFSTRKGGVSTGVYKSMNLSFRKDTRENVIKNYSILCNAIGCDYNNIVFSDQVHGNEIYNVTQKDRGKGLLRESDIKNIDALITNEKDVVLTTFYADCVPLYFLDVNKKVIALAHSGWRGTVKQIAAKTVNQMQDMHNCNPKDILVGIAPSIGVCCYETDELVVKEFKDSIPFSEKFIYKDLNKAGKYKIDLQNINREILINAGIEKQNIEIANICTKCNNQLLFSHRVMGNERGSLAALMQLL